MNSDSVFLITILLAFVFFAGDPDLSDAINKRVAGQCIGSAQQPAQGEKE